MRKKCLTGDSVNGEDCPAWEATLRYTRSATCPDVAFVFNFGIGDGDFSRVRIHSGVLDKPFAEEAQVTSNGEASTGALSVGASS